MSKAMLALALTGAAAATAVAVASAPASTPGSFVLQAKLDRKTLVMVDQRPKGRSAGDTVVFSTTLVRDGKADGRGEFAQTLVDNRYQGITIHGDLLLGDGTIELQGGGVNRRPPGGAAPRPNTDMAVVGGTGAYAGARGSVHFTNVSRTTQRLEISLAD